MFALAPLGDRIHLSPRGLDRHIGLQASDE
jgi:hypothetical protein